MKKEADGVHGCLPDPLFFVVVLLASFGFVWLARSSFLFSHNMTPIALVLCFGVFLAKPP